MGSQLILASSNVALATLAIAAISLVAAVVAVVLGRSKGMKDNIDIMATSNSELRDDNDDLRKEIARNKEDFKNQLRDQDEKCAREIAELRGKVDVLQSSVLSSMVPAIVQGVVVGIKEELKHNE